VTEHRDGQRAVEAAWAARFSLVILSADMPGVDGITACQILRRSPLAANVPIVMLLDPADGRDAFARDAGASSIVHAPVNVHALARTVREILAG
jgi:DNA-binding response OmpR family regulator